MNPLPTVEAIVKHAGKRFHAWFRDFRAYHGVQGITERNFSFQFATSFLDKFDDAKAFMEVPFLNRKSGTQSKHLDAYLFSKQFAVMLEAKGTLYSQAHVDQIASDIRRMSRGLLRKIQRRHPSIRPKASVGVVLTEAWTDDIEKWWKRDRSSKCRLLRRGLPDNWHYGSVPVFQLDDQTYYWLYAVGPRLM